MSFQKSKASILGVKVDDISKENLFLFFEENIGSQKKAIVANANIHAMNMAYKYPRFRSFLNQSDLVFCDGAGIKLASSILGHPLSYRITPADWIWDWAKISSERGYSIFFLGSKKGIAEKAADKMKERFSDLKIVGTHHGYFDMNEGSEENLSTINHINNCKPNVLIVSFGMPLQEKWLDENWNKIDANIAVTAGALLDYISGELTRAPRFLTDNGLEWLGRFLIEPHRLWRRYLIGNPIFFYRVLKERYLLVKSITDI